MVPVQDYTLTKDNSFRAGQGDDFLQRALKTRLEQRKLASPGEDLSRAFTLEQLRDKVKNLKSQSTEDRQFESLLATAAPEAPDGPLGLGVMEASNGPIRLNTL